MSTKGGQFGKEVFEDLNIEYENAYKNNPFKKACVRKAISLLKPGSRVLDVGCGTGVPVAAMLAEARMEVTGIDIAPKMIEIAEKEVKGRFLVADCLDYEPEGSYDAVFVSAEASSSTLREEAHEALDHLLAAVVELCRRARYGLPTGQVAVPRGLDVRGTGCGGPACASRRYPLG